MPLGEHLVELRRRIIYGLLGLVAAMALSLFFAPQIIGLLKRPYAQVMAEFGRTGDLAILDATAALTNYLKVSFYAGIVLASPWIFYQFWIFVSAGLYKRERRCVLLGLPLCAMLFIGGAVFFLLVVARRMLYFLLALSEWLGMVPVITFSSHISFMTRLALLFALAFQTPLLILTLAATHIVSIKALQSYRKHVVVGILIFAAMFTPPDPFSQMALAMPMWLLYEFGVLLAYLFIRRSAKMQSRQEKRPAG